MINIKLNIVTLSFLAVIMIVEGSISPVGKPDSSSKLAQMNGWMMMDPMKMIADIQANIARQQQQIAEQNAKRMASCPEESRDVWTRGGNTYTIINYKCADGSTITTTTTKFADGRTTTSSNSSNGGGGTSSSSSNQGSGSSSSSSSGGSMPAPDNQSSSSSSNSGNSGPQPAAVSSANGGAASAASSSGGGAGAMAMASG